VATSRKRRGKKAVSKTIGDEARRRQLLDLGLKLFGRMSFAEVSIDDIAAKAGISRGLLYHYFKGKRGFYNETVRYAAQSLVERLEVDVELDPEVRLREGLDRYIGYVEEFALPYTVLMRGGIGVDQQVNAIMEETRESILERMMSEGPEEMPRVPAVRAALRGWLRLVEGMCLDWIDRRELERHELVETLAAALEPMVEAAASAARRH
jgi:AcrR family transcriptional regulator